MRRVSAHNNLSKCVTKLPFFTQHYTDGVKEKQRCAVCYRLRCTGVKRFVYEGTAELCDTGLGFKQAATANG
jgi:hypothetical protein